MSKLRIYLDTSVINFVFADDAPDSRRVTVKFFERGYWRPLRVVSPLEVEDED